MTTKETILHTASDLFYKNGYNLTGINEIIAKAGIAKATLYSHFRSKEDLCIAYLEFKDQAFAENLMQFCTKKPQGDAQLLAVLEFLIPFFESDGFNGCWCIRTIAEIPKNNTRIREKIRTQKNTFLTRLQLLVQANRPDIEAIEQEKLANRIYLLYEAAVAESHLHEEIWPIYEGLDLLKCVLGIESK